MSRCLCECSQLVTGVNCIMFIKSVLIFYWQPDSDLNRHRARQRAMALIPSIITTISSFFERKKSKRKIIEKNQIEKNLLNWKIKNYPSHEPTRAKIETFSSPSPTILSWSVENKQIISHRVSQYSISESYWILMTFKEFQNILVYTFDYASYTNAHLGRLERIS